VTVTVDMSKKTSYLIITFNDRTNTASGSSRC